MRRIQFAALTSLSIFCSTTMTANFVWASDHTTAENAPILVGQRSIEFDDAPTTPIPGSNPVAPPYPQQPGPNIIRPDFDDGVQNTGISGKEFQTRNTKARQLRNKAYEVTQITSDGCQVVRVLNVSGSRPYVESIKIDPLNPTTCKTQAYLLRFQPDGSQIEIQSDRQETLTIQFSRIATTRTISQIVYRSATGKEELYTVRSKNKLLTIYKSADSEAKTWNKNLNQVDSSNLNSIKSEFLIANSDPITDSLSCSICKFIKTAWELTFGPSVADLLSSNPADRPEYFGGAGFVDDLLGLLADLEPGRPGSSVMFLINQFVGAFPAINNALDKTRKIGIDCKEISIYNNQAIQCEKLQQNAEAQPICVPCIVGRNRHGLAPSCPASYVLKYDGLGEQLNWCECQHHALIRGRDRCPVPQPIPSANTSPVRTSPNGVGACGSSLYGGAASAVCAPTYPLK